MSEGLRAGVLLGGWAVIVAILGLSPGFSWIPEGPFIGAAGLVALAILGWAGFRGAEKSSRLIAGPLTGALTGGIGGCIGGLAYVVAGKPALNIAVGFLLGAVAGAVLGLAGRLVSRRSGRGAV